MLLSRLCLDVRVPGEVSSHSPTGVSGATTKFQAGTSSSKTKTVLLRDLWRKHFRSIWNREGILFKTEWSVGISEASYMEKPPCRFCGSDRQGWRRAHQAQILTSSGASSIKWLSYSIAPCFCFCFCFPQFIDCLAFPIYKIRLGMLNLPSWKLPEKTQPKRFSCSITNGCHIVVFVRSRYDLET